MSIQLPSPFRSFLTLALPGAALLTGCYTQLASRGYQAGSYPPEAYAGGSAPDSAAAGDSAAIGNSPASGDGAKAPTVVVNNYYDTHRAYRGYAHWEWDYPLISFGYYSSRYDYYHRPWWWDDHRYHRGHPHHGHGHYRPATPVATPSGPYQSPKRLYNPEPAYRPVNKGRRSEEPKEQSPSAPAPSYTAPVAQPAPSQPASVPAAKSSGSDEGSKPSGTGESKPDDEYRSLKKGKRR